MSKPCRPVVILEAVEARRLMASIAVTTLADSGTGSLRAALAAANNGDTVDATALHGTITLASQLAITKNVVITGPGAADLTLDGNGHTARAIAIDAGKTVTISGLTIAHAGTPGETGGGINVDTGSIGNLTLDHVIVSDNLATGKGGGVYAPNTHLTLIASTFSDNEVSADSNGLAYGGGVSVQDGFLTATNCTFDHNRASATTFGGMAFINDATGGGVSIYGADQGSTVVTGCTFYANTVNATGASDNSSRGAGFDLDAQYGHLTFNHNTAVGNVASGDHGQGGGVNISLNTEGITAADNLVAGNTADVAPDANFSASNGLDLTYNLIGDGTASGMTNGVDHNLLGTTASPIDVKPGTFADHGGPVKTIALLNGSPAIDSGVAISGVTADARGVVFAAAPDIGAYEAPARSGAVYIDGSTLMVFGTAGDDVIRIYYPAHRQGLTRVRFRGKQWNFSSSTISSVNIDAGDGNDLVSVGLSYGIYAFGGAGNDTLIGGDGADSLSGGADNDSLMGMAGDDLLRGGGGRDRLFGDVGDDHLDGGTGSNFMDGGIGTNLLSN